MRNIAPQKKKWSKPELYLLSSADDIKGGNAPSLREAGFNPNHTHYNGPKGNGGVTTSQFNNYVS
ncbi:hypothetical protein HK413_07950 [Mucilaginibacter sp. S1162]|uniref:Uncharacterized protein n=1 Tax=Mucilaginibacter humi TaxID=2732510 RepID=A0ABX1W1N5_9SPHI|nr:hypothetical protein [Mucilaginibacter humi]NNU34093.1 hypothetical protein [Mucilaginibacter humi]